MRPSSKGRASVFQTDDVSSNLTGCSNQKPVSGKLEAGFSRFRGMLIDLTEPERHALAYLAGRELAENRYPLAPQLEPLRSAFRKLAPGMVEPKPRPRPRGARRPR